MDSRTPPRGLPRMTGFSRVYRTNLRPVVLAVAGLSALWSLFAGIGYFRSINIDKQQGVPKLGTFALIGGAIYMVLFVMEAFGVFAAAVQRLALARIYALLSLAIVALTAGVGIFQIVIHFTSKSDILKECTSLNTGDGFVVYPFGFFGPSRHETLSAADAADWCNNEYERNSWQDIVSVLVLIGLTSFFAMLAWGFYHQLQDPTSVLNFSRAPSNQVRVNFPTHYNPPYNASVPNLGYSYNPGQATYAPPPGPPPPPAIPSDTKPPGYLEAGDSKENPFADFDEVEHDVTSRPAPGGRDKFQV